jgi:diguanylate cyclase (GGDEF)-like protein
VLLALEVAYAGAALLCASLGVASWRRRHLTPAAGSLVAVMGGATWWALSDVLARRFPAGDPTESLMLARYPGAALLVAGFYCLCLALADGDWRPPHRMLLLLLIEPLLISTAAATNPLHELVLQPVSAADAPSFGPVFWAHSAYSYLLLASGLLRVWRQRRHAAALHARQLTSVLVAAVIPIIGNLLTLAGLAGTLDVTALLFVATGVLCAHAVFRQGLFEVVPIARARVLEQLEAAIVVLDEQDRLGDVNSAGIALLERAVPPGVPVVGTPAREALGGLAPVLLGEGGERHVRLADVEADLDVRVTTLENRRGRSIGRVLVVNDVTEATDARRRLTDSNVLLQQQVVMIERLRAELAEQAVRDVLTGLHNRRHLTRVLQDEVARAQETGEPLSVVLLDVDHFKQVNDTYGHATGDALLAGLGQALPLAVRPGDTVARFGGEEFVVVLPGLDLPAALERAERIREHCAAHPAVAGTGQHPTLSAGVATSGSLPFTPDELLESADLALYRAKAAGRNRVVGPLLAG